MEEDSGVQYRCCDNPGAAAMWGREDPGKPTGGFHHIGRGSHERMGLTVFIRSVNMINM